MTEGKLTISVCCYLPNFMLLQLKTSELGGGRNPPPPQVQRVFKRPGKIGLKAFQQTPYKSVNQGRRRG